MQNRSDFSIENSNSVAYRFIISNLETRERIFCDAIPLGIVIPTCLLINNNNVDDKFKIGTNNPGLDMVFPAHMELQDVIAFAGKYNIDHSCILRIGTANVMSTYSVTIEPRRIVPVLAPVISPMISLSTSTIAD